MNFLYDLAVYAIPLIFAITMHEAAHGWMISIPVSTGKRRQE